MKTTIEITDTDLLAGLTAARKRYVHENAVPEGFSDADYVRMIVTRACESYAATYVREPETLDDAKRVLVEERAMRKRAESEADSLRLAAEA